MPLIPALFISIICLIICIYCVYDFISRDDWISFCWAVATLYLAGIYYRFYHFVVGDAERQVFVRLGLFLFLITLIVDRIVARWRNHNE